MTASAEVTRLIPHRPPFLYVDRIVSLSEECIVTEKTFAEDLDVYRGHYPGNPLTPGVLLCEAAFQSAALLMSAIGEKQQADDIKIPVLTRIQGAKFKRTVLPGDTVRVTVQLKESVSSVYFFKASLRVREKVAVQVEFACSLVHSP